MRFRNLGTACSCLSRELECARKNTVLDVLSTHYKNTVLDGVLAHRLEITGRSIREPKSTKTVRHGILERDQREIDDAQIPITPSWGCPDLRLLRIMDDKR